MKHILLSAFFALSPLESRPQANSEDPVKKAIEFTLNLNIESINNSEELTSLFEELLSNPIMINDIKKNHLESIPFLSEFQITSITDYITEFGHIKSTNELQMIPGFDKELADILIPFISLIIPEDNIFEKQLTPLRHKVTIKSSYTFQKTQGFKDTTENKFIGTRPYYAYSFSTKTSNGITIQLRAEKDPGEPAMKPLFADSYGGFLELIKPFKNTPKIVIGDYSFNAGQGLISWSGFSLGKGSDPSLIRKRASFNSKKSFSEVNFYRGLALDYNYKIIKSTITFSNKLLDGNLSEKDSATFVIGATGLHRNSKEILKRSTIRHQTVGGKVGTQLSKSSIYFNFIHHKLSGYDRAESITNGSIDFNTRIFKSSLFGEIAIDNNLNAAIFFGNNYKISNKCFLTTSYRNYPYKFKSYLNNSFGENSNAANESGFYIGIKLVPQYKFSIIAFADFFNSPFPKYRIAKPSSGTETGISITKMITSYLEWKLGFIYKTKEIDILVDNNPIRNPEFISYRKIKTNIRFTPASNIAITTGSTFNTYKAGSSNLSWGFLGFANLEYQFLLFPITCYARFATFKAPIWELAFYLFENDTPGSYSISSLYQQGSRSYLMIKTQIFRKAYFWLKVSETFYFPPIAEIGSAQDKIKGSRKSDIKIQFTYEF